MNSHRNTFLNSADFIIYLTFMGINLFLLSALTMAFHGFPYYQEIDRARLKQVHYYEESKYNISKKVLLEATAAKALQDMIDAAEHDGIRLLPASGFRPRSYQKLLLQYKIAETGFEYATSVVAPGGYSEHHTGYAVDFGISLPGYYAVNLSFAESREFDWLEQNAASFGFDLSYPKSLGKQFEPWHWRFVGTPGAKRIFSANFLERFRNRLLGLVEEIT